LDDEPKTQKIKTEYGWDCVTDYGKKGVTTVKVHIGHGTPEDAARHRADLDRVLRQYGYQLDLKGDIIL
jgi:hypothetical protein